MNSSASSKVEEHFTTSLNLDSLRDIGAKLQEQLHAGLHKGEICMLPSYCHTLPSGKEKGSYLALDVGGSRLRVALVRLCGRSAGYDQSLTESKRHDYVIDEAVRSLVGKNFFHWMAQRIKDTIADEPALANAQTPLRMGISWSFPVEQLSIRDGTLLMMGKKFKATQGLLGHNLADLIDEACAQENINVKVAAIVNDSSSSLLSSSYRISSARIALILGTGLNSSIYLPTTSLASYKFGRRPSEWRDTAKRVVVNVELSTFGKDVFPLTRWDELLNSAHSNPVFQPLEHLTSGGYLGEIVRLVLVDAIQAGRLFGGTTPTRFQPYELDTETISAIEADTSTSLSQAATALSDAHRLPANRPYSLTDLHQVRRTVTLVSSRAAAFLAVSVVALYRLRLQSESAAGYPSSEGENIVIGCNGSVLEKYPRYRERAQAWIDALTGKAGAVRLEMTGDSALVGSAVAVACQS
ncbi:MAG: hypothetical protein M1831_007330 [Alyxoria varia]|nr:MAG: hypothetical protein M1831_007330 [Alyxoria varia]